VIGGLGSPNRTSRDTERAFARIAMVPSPARMRDESRC
jgi:hypothetical protein